MSDESNDREHLAFEQYPPAILQSLAVEMEDGAIVDAVDPAAVEPSPFDEGLTEEDVRAELAGVDVGAFANSVDEGELFRYLRRRGQLLNDIERIKEHTEAMLRQLNARVKGLDYLYLGMAQTYARDRLTGKKAKSVKTPFGILGFRMLAGGVEVENPQELIAAAQTKLDYMPLVLVKESVSKEAVNTYFKDTGELPPGCTLKPAVDKFYIK